MKKRLLGCGIPLIIVVALCWWGWRSLTSVDPKPNRFETVDKGDVEIKVTETGTIEPLTKVEIKSKVAGRLSKLYVQEGDKVQAGQLLAEIDPTEINSQVEQMRAQLQGAEARLQAGKRNAIYQAQQTVSGVKQAEESLESAQEQLKVAEEENSAQPNLTRSAIDQAQAALKTARDSLTLLKNSTHPQALVSAQSSYDEAQAGEENSRRNLDRQRRLLEKGFVSQQQVDAAVSDMAAARAKLQQAKKRLDLIAEQNRLEIANAENRVAEAQAAYEGALANKSQMAIKDAGVKSATAAVEQARALLTSAQSGKQQDRMRLDEVKEAEASVSQLKNSLNEVEVHQTDTRLVSTMAGIVTRRYIEQGELVTSGVSTFSSGTPILQVADLSQMLVQLSVNEVDVHKIRIGLPVEITIDGARGTTFTGHVSKVAPAAGSSDAQAAQTTQGGVVRFAVEVRVDHPDIRMKPGMSARCNIIIDRRRDVVRLPTDCVEGDGDKASVQIGTEVVKNGKKTPVYTPRKIKAGLRGDTFIEIISGIKVGERVKPGVYNGPKRKTMDIGMN